MHFADLTPYVYGISRHLPTVLNVGWLGQGEPFTQGKAPPDFVPALKRWACKGVANQMRGFHTCGLCPSGDSSPMNLLPCQMSTVSEGQTLWLGSAEMWIPGDDDTFFAAPTLIIHYVEAHDYLPPKRFVEAVLKAVPADWDASRTAEEMIQKAYAP